MRRTLAVWVAVTVLACFVCAETPSSLINENALQSATTLGDAKWVLKDKGTVQGTASVDGNYGYLFLTNDRSNKGSVSLVFDKGKTDNRWGVFVDADKRTSGDWQGYLVSVDFDDDGTPSKVHVRGGLLKSGGDTEAMFSMPDSLKDTFREKESYRLEVVCRKGRELPPIDIRAVEKHKEYYDGAFKNIIVALINGEVVAMQSFALAQGAEIVDTENCSGLYISHGTVTFRGVDTTPMLYPY